MILGVTGSIGSGKTTAAKIFSKYHYSRIDADEIGHELLKSNKKIKNKILKEFGKGILDKNNNINRKKLGKIVFNYKAKLKKLNSIMHPAIINEIKNQINKSKNKNIVIDSPLLLETDAKNLVDEVVVVKSDIKYISRRNKNFSKEYIKKISKSQMPMKEKIRHADYVVDNNGDLEELRKQVKDAIKFLSN